MTATNDADRWHPALSVAAVLEAAPAHDELPVRVEVFTDPFSAWCWGNQPDWHKLCEIFGNLLEVRFRMVGLIQDLEAVPPSGGSLRDPARMAAQWEEIAHLTGMPLDPDRWLLDPPNSSWPACAAIAAALAHDPVAGELFLRRCRETALCLRGGLANTADLLALARSCDIDAEALATDLASGAAGALLTADLEAASKFGGITCPTYVFTGGGGTSILKGSRPFPALVDALSEAYDDALPLLTDPADVTDRGGYARALAQSRGSTTAAELAILLDIERADATDLLDRLCAGGHLCRHKVGRHSLYRAA